MKSFLKIFIQSLCIFNFIFSSYAQNYENDLYFEVEPAIYYEDDILEPIYAGGATLFTIVVSCLVVVSVVIEKARQDNLRQNERIKLEEAYKIFEEKYCSRFSTLQAIPESKVGIYREVTRGNKKCLYVYKDVTDTEIVPNLKGEIYQRGGGYYEGNRFRDKYENMCVMNFAPNYIFPNYPNQVKRKIAELNHLMS